MLWIEGTDLVEMGSLVAGDVIVDVNGTEAIVEAVHFGNGSVCVPYRNEANMGNVLIKPVQTLIRKKI